MRVETKKPPKKKRSSTRAPQPSIRKVGAAQPAAAKVFTQVNGFPQPSIRKVGAAQRPAPQDNDPDELLFLKKTAQTFAQFWTTQDNDPDELLFLKGMMLAVENKEDLSSLRKYFSEEQIKSAWALMSEGEREAVKAIAAKGG